MNKEKLSDIYDNPTIEETEILISDNINATAYGSKKNIIKRKVLKQIPSVKKVFIIERKGLVPVAAMSILLIMSLSLIYLFIKKNTNRNTLITNPTPTIMKTPSKPVLSTPTVKSSITPTLKPSATPTVTKTPTSTLTTTHTPTPVRTPSQTPIQPRDGVEKNWPNDDWIPASAKAFMAQYPKGYSYFDYDTRNKIIFENLVDAKMVKAIENFSYKSANKILNSNENINYCPLSLYFALSICATGTEGETNKEYMNLLGLNGMSKEFLLNEARKVYNRLYFDNEFGKMKIANSLWLSNHKGVSFKDDFINNIKQNFFASLFNVDFTDKDTSTLMKKWIFDNTEGTLAPEIQNDPTTLFSIINTIYYKNEWVEPFEKKYNYIDKFYNNNGSYETEFMNRKTTGGSYYKGKDYVSTSLRLKRGNMVFILPDEGVSIHDFLTEPDKLKAAINSPTTSAPLHDGYLVNLSLPKFEFENSLKLIDTLKELGLNNALREGANYSGITDIDITINKVVQDLYIHVDEQGVTAAAATNMSGGYGDPIWMNVEVKLNRPFIFCIMNEDLPIFIGVYANPT